MVQLLLLLGQAEVERCPERLVLHGEEAGAGDWVVQVCFSVHCLQADSGP